MIYKENKKSKNVHSCRLSLFNCATHVINHYIYDCKLYEEDRNILEKDVEKSKMLIYTYTCLSFLLLEN